MRFPVQIPPGIVSDDTELAKGGRWSDGDKVRFSRERAELIGGHERIFRTALEGICRGAFAWYDNAGSLNLAFGTHSHVYVWKGGLLTDITPTLAMPAVVLGGLLSPSPLAVTDGSAVVTVTHKDHGLETGDSIIVSGAVSVGRIVPNGTFSVTKTDDDHYTYTFSSPADLAETLGNNPLSVTSGQAKVTVTDTAHGLADGTVVTFSGAAAVGGITPNGAFPVTVIDANSYSFTFTSDATSTATGGGAAVVATVPATGGGTAVKIAPQKAFQPGQINGTGGRGYGTGAYGVGGYGQPSDTEYFPRTWSFGALGENLVCSPRGGTIYIWQNDTAENAEPITNAPRTVTHMLVTPERVIMALGCNQEDGSGFNPRCIRHTDSRITLTEGTHEGAVGYEVWDTDVDTLAREKILEGAGVLVAGRNAGYGNFVLTDNECWDCRYVGSLDEVYSFSKLGEDCGLIGPNAIAVKNQRAFWWTLDYQFMTCALGGEPQSIANPLRDELEENLAPVQRNKIYAATISGRNEAWFFYPDNRDGLENSRAVFFSTTEGWFGKAQMPRTAFIDAGPALYPLGVDPEGNVFWHERGESADGEAISWSLESAPQYIDSGERLIFVRSFYPDFKGQQGAISLTIITREEAQGQPTEHGPFVITPTTEVVDLDVEARLVSFRISGSSAPASFRLGTIIFEGRQAGRR
jgi:hypothetical protein